MKKLIVFMLVLGLASTASATVSFELGSMSIVTGTTKTFNIVSDTTDASTNYVGNAPGLADLTGMAGTANAADYKIVESPYGYNGYWGIESYDATAATWSIQSGVHFIGTLTAFSTQGNYTLSLYASNFTTVIDTLPVTIIPEPITIALLGLGGLFLRRRR